MLRKLAQDNNTVPEYYDSLCTALLRCGLEEREEDFLSRFWKGLNHDIQDIIMHEELYFVDHLFCLACKAEQTIRRHVCMMNKRAVESPSQKDYCSRSTANYDYDTWSLLCVTTVCTYFI